MNDAYYHIGTPGQAWGPEEKQAWLAEQKIRRSYQDDVVAVIDALKSSFTVTQYGSLDYYCGPYPLFILSSPNWQANRPTALVTGGVHGYETSGVHGALGFLQTKASDYFELLNILVAPCISPWGYETINRWNPDAIDPNRSFINNSPAQESAALMAYLEQQSIDVALHIDLHETTDTDNSEFRPALAARDAVEHAFWDIPDGFYGVGDSENPQAAFQKAIIDSVKKVTHIAPADAGGRIIGEPIAQEGVINYALKKLGLCASVTNARLVSTTEVYPDSPKTTPQQCIAAQVAAVQGALDYLLAKQD